MTRWLAQPDKARLALFSTRLAPFITFSVCPSLLPFPPPAGTVPATPSSILDPLGCIPMHCQVPVCLWVLASPPVAVTGQLCFCLLCLLMLIVQVSRLCVFVSLPFLILLTDKTSIPMLHTSLPITVTDVVCSHPHLPHHVSVRFVSLFSLFLFVSPLTRYAQRSRHSPPTFPCSYDQT